MSRIVEKQLQRREINRALWLLGKFAEWNQQDGYPADAATSLITGACSAPPAHDR
jgi:hypothetical protein